MNNISFLSGIEIWKNKYKNILSEDLVESIDECLLILATRNQSERSIKLSTERLRQIIANQAIEEIRKLEDKAEDTFNELAKVALKHGITLLL